ncbi:hypothetical protein [Pontibacter lucknowensis]|uniref:YXWGXW repeat-containing protein n=1 Tax=Pontibacter lucknowensis TaxID=1077936 RepID=A0A1N6UG76_9BACT|nr:hypothetical protein [Pontibacter lucknowensis]SIQ64590.1 hypothetical protein SAMN05421545_0866 [Pontibacter lucknowensis]
MKKLNIYTALAPVIALFAVGCSSPVAMQSTEYDDMYYSSSDRTEYVQPQAQASQQQQYAPAEDNQQAATGDVTQNYTADEYYDGRTYRPQATWNTPNYAYVDPYWTTAYVHRRVSPFYDPFFYDPFYDPFMYDPFFHRGGMRVNIGLSMGWGSGWNRWGHPWGRPYGMYDPFWGGGFWPHNNYYAGFYHGYNRGFYGSNRYIYDRPGVVQQRQVQYGPRGERSVVPASGNPERVAGRPNRSESVRDEQRSTQGVDYARPGRTERATGNTNVRGQEINAGENTGRALPSRPATTNRGYDPQSGQVRPSRQQPEGQQPVQRLNQSREEYVSPSVQPRERQQRIQQPTQRQERIQQPVQRQQIQRQPVQRSQPSYQRSQPVQRSQPSYQRSQPVQRSQPSYSPPTRSSGTSSPPVRTNSSGGGRGNRGGN